MGASVHSKVTWVSKEASLLLSRSKEDRASLFFFFFFFLECSCHGDERVWVQWLRCLCSLSGPPHSALVQEEQVYQRWARRPRQLISSSPLSDELAAVAAWLRGKVANSLKAFQLRLATLSVCLRLCFIPSHASENKHTLSFSLTHTHTHTHTQTPRRQNNFGSRGLSIKLKTPARIWSKDEDIRELWCSLPGKQGIWKKRHTCAIRLYTVILHTHLETLKRSAADTHTHKHTHLYADRQTTGNKTAREDKKIWSMKGRVLGEYLDPHQMNTLVKGGVNLWKWWFSKLS